MRQGHKAGPYLRQFCTAIVTPEALFGQVVCQAYNHQRKAHLPQRRKRWRTPLGRTLAGAVNPRWTPCPIAQARKHKWRTAPGCRTARGSRPANRLETVAAGIVERNACFMHLAAWSLGRK